MMLARSGIRHVLFRGAHRFRIGAALIHVFLHPCLHDACLILIGTVAFTDLPGSYPFPVGSGEHLFQCKSCLFHSLHGRGVQGNIALIKIIP